MLQVLPTTYTGRGKWKTVADALNRIGRVVNGFVGVGMDIEAVGDEVRFYAGARRGVVSPRAALFEAESIDDSDGTIRMGPGVILHGTRWITIEPADVAVAGGTEENPSYIVVRYQYGSAFGAYLPASVSDRPSATPTQTAFQCPVLSVYRDRGAIRIGRQMCSSVIVISSVWSPQ